MNIRDYVMVGITSACVTFGLLVVNGVLPGLFPSTEGNLLRATYILTGAMIVCIVYGLFVSVAHHMGLIDINKHE